MIAPCRLYDSRLPDSNPQGPLTSGVIYSIDLPEGRCGLPPDAVVLVLNVTAISNDVPAGIPRAGYISVFQGGTAPPGFGVSFREGRYRAQFFFIRRGTSPDPDLAVQGVTSSASFHVLIDIMGYLGSGLPSGISLDNASVQENQPSGTLVGNLSTVDPDIDEVHAYTLVPGDGDTDNAKFQISGARLLTGAPLDYETQSTYSIRLRSTGFMGVFIEQALTITMMNQNEAPSGLSLSSTSVGEGLPAGTLVGTFSSTDPDGGNSHTYSFVTDPLGPDNGAFQISGAQLLTNAVFDRETKATYIIYVQAADTGGLTFKKQLTITVDDANDPPAPSGGPFSMAENSGAGTGVGPVMPNDPDPGQSHTFTILSGNTGMAFAIHPTNGSITVATPAALDFETTPLFNLVVQVTDGGSPALSGSTTVTIQLTNVNEPPVVSGGGPFSGMENGTAGTVIGTITASDPDGGQFTYAITGGNLGGAFAIDPLTGVITIAMPSALDFETTPVFNLTIVLTDNGSPARSTTLTVTIQLTDVNEAAAPSGGPFSVMENSASGTSVGTVAHNDPDSGQPHIFTITGGNTAGAFAIDPATGEITVANSAALSFETTPSFNLTVEVTDNGSPALSGTTTVVVNLTDVNEAPAPTGGPFSLAENSPAATVVGTVTANDPDSGQSFTFAITGGNPGDAFAIHPTTGQITVATPPAVDFETNPVFNLTVRVTDNGSPSQFGSTTVVINLTNANDAPVVSGGPFTVPENTGNGTTVGTATRTDQDSGQSHTFAITAGNPGGAFTINAASGVIRVANSSALNFESTPVFNLTVRVTDNGSPSMSGTATVTVNLSNVAEVPVASDEGSAGSPYVETVGNTLLEVTTTPSLPHPKIVFSGNVLTNDSDPDGPTALMVTLESSTPGAEVTLNTDGTFTYLPPVGFLGVDTFTYRITDPTSLFDTATVYINVEGQVWYVKNDAAAGGLGRSTDPFDLLSEAETASDTSDTIYLFAGDGTTLGQSDGITLKSGQRLIGEAVPLVVPSVNINGVVGPTLHPAGNRPKIENDATPDAAGEDNGVTIPAISGNASNVEIRGLDIAGLDNAVDLTVGSKIASVTMRDNVISGAGLEGIDVNASSTGQVTLAIHDTTLTATGDGISVASTGTADVHLTVTGGVFQNIGGSALQADGDGDSRRTVTVSGAAFRDNNRGVHLLGSGNADLTFGLTGNTFLRHALEPIQISSAASSTNAMGVVGTIDANVIGDGAPDSGSASSYGIAVDLNGDADSILAITSNTVDSTELDGIYAQTRLDADAEIGRLDLTLRDNAIQAPEATAYGTLVEARDTTTICLDIAGNSSAGGGLEGFQTRQAGASTFLLERLSDGNGTPDELVTDMAAVETFLAGQNDAGSTADATQESAATGYTEAADGACRKPAL